jgi:hypothetical protein
MAVRTAYRRGWQDREWQMQRDNHLTKFGIR